MNSEATAITELREQLMLWVKQTKQLLGTLPTLLTELEQLRGETGTLHQRISDLEGENHELSRSRDHLAETFGKLREIIAGHPGDDESAGTEPQQSSAPSAAALSAFANPKLRLASGLNQPAMSP